jgi:hypothetical protein
MRDRRSAFAGWLVAVVALVPASVALWWIGGMAACGEEVYDTPPGSFGDRVCATLVKPVVPWAALTAVPLAVALVVGAIALRGGNRRLLQVAIAVPILLIVGGVFAFLAVF